MSLREKLHETIFEADTPTGKVFDITLLLCILMSILIVMLESVQHIGQHYSLEFYYIEWAVTILFTIEYLARLYAVERPLKYAFSFYGIIDLLAILPTYISLFLDGAHFLLVVRSFRLLRIFRVFKLARYLSEARVLGLALAKSRHKISVFLVTVITISITMGTVMFLVEGPENGFTSIPRGVYWAIVTLTTVGYGDISPHTAAGQTIATLIMIMGYGIIAVPTGIVSAELTRIDRHEISTQACPSCSAEGHDHDAVHCKYCGATL